MSILTFIIDVLLSLGILVFLLRVLFTLVATDIYNPLCQFIYRITEPLLSSIRPFVRSWGNIDIVCLLLAYALSVLKKILSMGFVFDGSIRFSTLLITSLVELTQTMIHIYMFSLIVLAISSWFITPTQRLSSPLLSILHALAEPLLRPVRRALSNTGPIDFSTMIAVFALYILSSFLQLLLFNMR